METYSFPKYFHSLDFDWQNLGSVNMVIFWPLCVFSFIFFCVAFLCFFGRCSSYVYFYSGIAEPLVYTVSYSKTFEIRNKYSIIIPKRLCNLNSDSLCMILFLTDSFIEKSCHIRSIENMARENCLVNGYLTDPYFWC